MVGLVLSILFDSICNDICVHYLAFAVDDSALNTAKRIRRERVLRAAKELRTHDIACRVLHAGPTLRANFTGKLPRLTLISDSEPCSL